MQFDERDRRSMSGMFGVTEDERPKNTASRDIHAGVSGMSASLAASAREYEPRGGMSGMISAPSEDDYEPFIDQLKTTVFTVRVDNVMEDFVRPFKTMLTDFREEDHKEQFERDYMMFRMLGRQTAWLEKIARSTAFFIRPQSFFGTIFEKFFVSRRRESVSVVNAIMEQTEFMRTGQLERERTILERIFEPQAIGRAFLSLATGFGIGRDKSREAEEKKARGEQLGLLERMSAALYKDITFTDHQARKEQMRDESLMEQMKAIEGTITSTFNYDVFHSALEDTNSILFDIKQAVSNENQRIGSDYSPSFWDSNWNLASMENEEDKEFVFGPSDDNGFKERDISMLEFLKMQALEIKDSLPDMVDNLKAVVANTSKQTGLLSKFKFAGSALAGGAGAAVGRLSRFDKGFSAILGRFFGKGGAARAGAMETGKSIWGRIGRAGPLSAIAAAMMIPGMTQNNMKDNSQLAGLFTGGLAGAKLGAMGGSALGPWGSLIGGIGGGIAGGVIGENAGEAIGQFLTNIFKKKEGQTTDAAGNLITKAYDRMSEDIDTESKTAAGRFTEVVIGKATSAFGGMWGWVTTVGRDAMSSVWDFTKTTATGVGGWVTETVSNFAKDGAVRLANTIVDSVAEVAPLIGSTIFKGVVWTLTKGLPAVGSMWLDISKWLFNEFWPWAGGVIIDLMNGIGKFVIEIYKRAYGAIGSFIMDMVSKLGDWITAKWDAMIGWMASVVPDWLKESANTIEDVNQNVDPTTSSGMPGAGARDSQNQNKNNSIPNTNEVGGADYREIQLQQQQEDHNRALIEAEQGYLQLLQQSVNAEENMKTTLEGIRTASENTVTTTQKLAEQLSKSMEDVNNIDFSGVDPTTWAHTFGMNE